MYKIIGADQREYGPCSADDLRRWFREGRVNAQTLLQPVGATDWKPLAAFPEFAPLLSGALPPGVPPTIGPTTGMRSTPADGAPPTEAELLQRDYDLDVFDCLRRGWDLFVCHFWPIVGVSLLVLLANEVVDEIIWMIVFPSFGNLLVEAITNPPSGNLFSRFLSADNLSRIQAISVLTSVVKPIFLGGLFNYYLRLIRGQKAELTDAFAGFRSAAVPLILFGLVGTLLEGLGWSLCLVPGIYLNVAWFFSVPLIMDRQLNFWAAMELSRKIVTKHWLLIFGLVLLTSLIRGVGSLTCCFKYAIWPAAYLCMLFAYEDIF